MKRRLLAALLLAAIALDAAAQRISLEVPLSPAPSLGAAAAVNPLANTFPLGLPPWTPGLAVQPFHIPLNAKPIALAPV